MINLYNTRFSVFMVLDILGLYLCSFILKKFIKQYPAKLIPLTNVVLSVLTTIMYFSFKGLKAPLHFILIMGLIQGLAVVGLHQLIKRTKEFIKLRRYFRKRQSK